MTDRPTPSTPPRTFPVDVEHAGIRLALPLIMILAGVGAWLGLATPLDELVYNLSGVDGLGGIASAVVGVAVAILGGLLADRALKALWPSGRKVTLDANALTFHDNRSGKTQTALRLDRRLNTMLWRFAVKRSTPKAQAGWIMLALLLSQDDTAITLYTFMPPKRAKALANYEAFKVLLSPKNIEKNKLGLRETADQRRLMKLEADRWNAGAELRPADFEALLDSVYPLTVGASLPESAPASVASLGGSS